MSKCKYKLNKNLLAKRMYNYVAAEQTDRLIAYAKREIVELVETHEFLNDTMNLQDSYVWMVYFNGKKAKHGFYANKAAKRKSVLHEFTPEYSVEVDGRALARDFVNKYKPTTTKGWEIVFAACAPYGAYLEGGFTLHGKRYQFNVMSQCYDDIRNTLSPLCKVTMEINPPRY